WAESRRHRDHRRRGRSAAGRLRCARALARAWRAGEGRARGARRGRALDRRRGRALRGPLCVVPGEPEGGPLTTLRLNGRDLTIADVIDVARGDAAVALDRAAEHRVNDSAKLVAELAKGNVAIYGVNTGFGDLATVRVPPDQLRDLQQNLVRSHSVGVGDALPEDVVRAILLLRANTLAAGRSGVRKSVIDLLLDLLNERVHPVIPQHGSVGASGDLAPLAHATLVLIGEGEATIDGLRMSGAEALRKKGLSPVELGPKEGLALLNGTQVMTAIGCLALHDAEILATSADV